MQEHEYLPATADGKRWCKHCGSMLHPSNLQTCIERASIGSALMPEPERREYASEAWDAIGARLAELRGEQQAILDAPAPVEMSGLI